MLKKTLSAVLDRIPSEGIGETELAIELGIKRIADLRSRLAQLVSQGEIEQCEDNPSQYRRLKKHEPTEAEVWELIPDGEGIDEISMAVALNCHVPEITTILKRLKNQGKITQRGEEWYKNDPSSINTPRTTSDSVKAEVIDFEETETHETGDGAEMAETILVASASSARGELTDEDLADRTRLERKIERGFYEAGRALSEIRERKLYRDKWRNFENYVFERFGFKRDYAYKQITAAEIVDELSEVYTISIQSGTPTVTLPLPTAETQVRPLSSLSPSDRAEVWREAVEKANGRVPSERTVKAVVKDFQLKDLCKSANPYKIGQIVTAKGKKGWFVVRDLGEFTCSCHAPTGEVCDFHHFDLKEIDYPLSQREFMAELQKRLARLWQTADKLTSQNDSGTIKALVSSIALNASGFLTDLQTTLLETAERETEEEF